MLQTLITVALCTLVALAVTADVRTRRIPNVLTVSGLLAALMLRAALGLDPFVAGVLGAVAAFACAVPLVALGGLGGGDAKLLAAVGAFVGLPGLPVAFLVTALVGGAMAVVAVARQRALRETLVSCVEVVTGGTPERPRRTLATPGAIAIPYGVAIGAGALAGYLA
ncbi:MAG: prepilin peptidase [Gemmatimonadota bacterium]